MSLYIVLLKKKTRVGVGVGQEGKASYLHENIYLTNNFDGTNITV